MIPIRCKAQLCSFVESGTVCADAARDMTTRAAFFCSDPIGVPVMDVLHNGGVAGFELCGVVTGPDRRTGRGKRLQPNAVAVWSSDHGLPLHQPQHPGDETIDWLARHGTDVLLVIAYGHILRRPLLAAARLGAWNLHGSLLPKYRGASPVESAIAEGEKITGVSLMRMVPAMDAGPLLASKVVAIDDDDTGPSLRAKMGLAAADLTAEAFARVLDIGVRIEEQDHGSATYCRKLTAEDRSLDFRVSAVSLERRIRALSGWPGSVLELADGTQVKVDQPMAVDGTPGEAEAGTVLGLVDGGLGIATAAGVLVLGALQKPGGKMLPAADFLRGFPIVAGSRLKSLPMKALVVTR